jgi:hypothetical protein
MPRSPWSARGIPLVRRSAAGARAGESWARPADAIAGMPGLVRECLLRPPQPDTLHVARAGARAGRQLRRARTAHRLEPWEELIAVWQWARVLGVIAGPTSWRSPNADQSAELIAADLTRIRELTSLAT